ncbi:killer toxin alpha/beta [Thozetella sp. PMI_491]|nr:killer toxin alpha/beta [Thozetella sp. PMI_491]
MAVAAWTSLAVQTFAQTAQPSSFFSATHPCPASCEGKPENWTLYSSVERLGVCNQPMMLDFAIYNPLEDPATTVKLRACTAGDENDLDNALLPTTSENVQRSGSAICIEKSETKLVTLDVAISSNQGATSGHNLHAALDQIRGYMGDSENCDTGFIVGFARQAAVAVYSGAAIDNAATVSAVLQQLMAQVDSSNMTAPKSIVTQLCGENRTADYTFGIAIDTTGDLAAVQQSVKAWSDAVCVNGTQATSQLKDVSIVQSPLALPDTTAANWTLTNGTISARSLEARADCRTVTVVSGDSCGSLASKCGITAAQFTQFNPSSTLCSTLQIGQRVCCSSGTLPDIRPKPNPDGSCSTYTVKSGDWCAAIAAAVGLQAADLDTFNAGTTWGWSGCNNLFVGINICLSTGTPPLPAPVTNAVCGPTVPGSPAPNASQNLGDMNPCPLKSCCNIWGQCGITPEYCDATRGPTNNPGTAPPGKNGCISNCGISIANQQQPGSFIKVGYYESWNWDRECLNYRPIQMAATDYTHAHWGFAALDSSFNIIIDDAYNQLPDFLSLPQKKILSFGGWGFSTEPATFELLRNAMNPGNAGTFAQNIVNYLNAHGWDGVDIDWEYPGAPDIPGIPPGLASDGPNYLAFLKLLKSKLPSGKSMSIAAPASYWYLKAFPIAEMAQYLDYIVYMTYDLHGQWDYGNQFSQEGCLSGNCLRSHVNLTETTYALSMITKAGVPTNKITVGVSSYGRSFKMTQPGCSGPMCPYAGPESQAAPGQCTVTPGYISNAEIESLVFLADSSTQVIWDEASSSDILVYNGDEWVAYMSDNTKKIRVDTYRSLGFAGTVDWAVDLQNFGDFDGDPAGEEGGDEPITSPLTPCTDTYGSIEALDAAASKIPMHCRPVYTLAVLQSMLKDTIANYTNMLNHGYDGKFNTYSKAVADSASTQVKNFVMGNGNKYFTCVVAELGGCCEKCGAGPHQPNDCFYCFDGPCTIKCIAGVDCPQKRWEMSPLEMSPLEYRETGPGNGGGGLPTEVDALKWTNVTEPCPPDYSMRGPGPDNPYTQTVYWSLSKGDEFFADLLSSTGIPKDKIGFADVDRGQPCAPTSGPDAMCRAIGMDHGFPVPQGFGQGDVTNPKDLVQAALSKIQNFMPQIESATKELSMDSWYGDWADLLDTVSMPVFMLAAAVENMATIEETADEIDEERRKAIILAFLGAILFIVPVIGEVVGSIAELGNIAAIITTLGAVGNVALDIYTIVDDPANAPLAIFDIVLSPLALADAAALARAASFRRAMSADDIAKLGEKVSTRMNTVKKLTGKCTKSD